MVGYLHAADKPMNILVLYADDWRYESMGCAGNEIIKTPTVDSLAKQGMRFTRNCVTTSICGASRACLFTGQWISRNGSRGFNAFRTPWKETYPGLLRANGYYVGQVGKWHTGPPVPKEFDFSTFYSGKHWYPVEGPPVKPDPSKKYYIDCPAMGVRLAGGGPEVSQWGYNVVKPKGVKTTETGANVEWKFVAAGDKWFVQLAEGGENCRLWANKLNKAQGIALSNEKEAGSWSTFTLSGVGKGKCFITCPAGPKNYQRLGFEKSGRIKTTKSSDGSAGCQVVLTEVESGKTIPDAAASSVKEEDGVENGNIHVTKRNEKDAMKFLAERPKDKPFCLTVAFFAPHAEDYNKKQYLPQSKTMELYKDAVIPMPKVDMAESWARMPAFFKNGNEGRTRWKWRFDNPDKYQTMMKNYYRLITEVDATCGKILDELKKQGVLDNTLVIFTTDNGYYHGEHGLADKWYPHEESIRVPLVIVDPRMKQKAKGKTNDEFTLSVDLAPTILGAAGIELPARMQGKDMSPLYLSDDKPEWRQEFFYEHPQLRRANFIPASQALVRKEWKYMYWPAFKTEQLFHLKTDPNEEEDLINDPEHASVLEEMRTRFAELKEAAK